MDQRVFIPNFDMRPVFPPQNPAQSGPRTDFTSDRPAGAAGGSGSAGGDLEQSPSSVTPRQSPEYGPRVREPQETIQINRRPVAAETAVEEGAFFGKRKVVGGAGAGDIYLQGGQVSGGTGNETVDEFKIYDASSDNWAGSAGQHLQLTVTGSGAATSGILDPVFDVTSASLSVVSSVGGNTLPSGGSLSGKICRISLGEFTDDGFSPALPGNINVGFCWGGYNISRF